MILKPRFLFYSLIFMLVMTVGCSRANGNPGSDPVDVATATGTSAAATSSPEPSPTATATPEPTPIPAAVMISDQSLEEDGVLVADLVSLPASGWLVIYRAVDGEFEDVIGQQPLVAGVHERVEVIVDTELATEQLFAGVHEDVGAAGVFEFPGDDEPYPGEPEAAFTVELLLPTPQIEVSDQAVSENGQMSLTGVEVLEPTWVTIHADEGGEIGPIVGSLLLEPGVYENVALTLDWRRATPVLYVILHEDEGKPGVLEYPDADMPILRGGEPIVVTLNATYPPEVLVYDQPVIDGTVSIERVISQGPGWIAVYNEAEGQPGFIIGTAALDDGLNEHVTVSLQQSGITTQLFARLHQDTDPGDAFNFPGQDPPVLFNNRMPNAAAFRTDAGAHVFIRDQRLGEGDTVRVAVVISPVDAWAAVYDDAEGRPGELLGQTWVPAGVNRDILVELSGSPAPGTLHLALYEDLGTRETFEVPGVDLELTNDNNRPVRVPFELLPSPGD